MTLSGGYDKNRPRKVRENTLWYLLRVRRAISITADTTHTRACARTYINLQRTRRRIDDDRIACLRYADTSRVRRVSAGGERVLGRGTPDAVPNQRLADAAQRGDANAQVGGGRVVGGRRSVAHEKRGGQRGQLRHVHQLQVAAIPFARRPDHHRRPARRRVRTRRRPSRGGRERFQSVREPAGESQQRQGWKMRWRRWWQRRRRWPKLGHVAHGRVQRVREPDRDVREPGKPQRDGQTAEDAVFASKFNRKLAEHLNSLGSAPRLSYFTIASVVSRLNEFS